MSHSWRSEKGGEAGHWPESPLGAPIRALHSQAGLTGGGQSAGQPSGQLPGLQTKRASLCGPGQPAILLKGDPAAGEAAGGSINH